MGSEQTAHVLDWASICFNSG